jgi:hypothetical protein
MDANFLKSYLHYDPVTGQFIRLKQCGTKLAGSKLGSLTTAGYYQITVAKRTYTAQRLAWLYVHGGWPNGVIDHINRNKSDNRIENLRDVNRSQNAHNVEPKSTRIRGVCLRSLRRGKRPSKPWAAYITINGVNKHLGTFFTQEEAAKARTAAVQQGIVRA